MSPRLVLALTLITLFLQNVFPIYATEISNISVRSIITSRSSIRSDLMIVKSKTGYRADHYQYTQSQVDALKQAIEHPPIHKLNFIKLEVTREWLQDNHEMGWNSLPQSVQKKINREKFEEYFQDEKRIRDLIANYYKKKWQGDYPEVVVEIALDDGKVLHAI